MRTLRAVGAVGGALAAALGVSLVACSGVSSGYSADGGPEAGGDGGIRSAGGMCTNPRPVVVGGKDTGFIACDEGYQHRTRVADCPSLAPRAGVQCGNGGGKDAGQECGVDSDCTAKPNGICRASSGGAVFCGCAYGCVRDSDCPAGDLCECAAPVGFCARAKCTTDGNCGPSSLCASAVDGFGGCGGNANIYVCQTVQDRCTVRTDCAAKPTGSSQVCGFDQDAGVRGCGEGALACPGRPFLVDDVARVAPLARRGDWSAEAVHPATRELSLRARAALADYWSRAIGETLAAVEATDALAAATDGAVRDALARIAADETRHAELAWRVARWLVDRGDATFRAWAVEELARAVAERRAASREVGAGNADAQLRAHGLLDEETRMRLASAALRDVVVPCGGALFGATFADPRRASGIVEV